MNTEPTLNLSLYWPRSAQVGSTSARGVRMLMDQGIPFRYLFRVLEGVAEALGWQ